MTTSRRVKQRGCVHCWIRWLPKTILRSDELGNIRLLSGGDRTLADMKANGKNRPEPDIQRCPPTRIIMRNRTSIFFVKQSACIALLIGFGISTTANAADSRELKITKITSTPNSGKSQLSFSNGVVVSYSLERIKPIAVLRTPSGSPRILLSGADCTECDMNESIYLLPLENQTGILPRSAYPGNLKAYDTGELVEKHRMFYGSCLSNEDSVVWFSDFVGDDNKWHHQNSVIHVKDSGSDLVDLLPSEGTFKSILEHVANGECKELKGIDGTTEP